VAPVDSTFGAVELRVKSGPDIRLWDIQTGECHQIIKQDYVDYVCFFPLDPKHLISISGGKVWQWNISGQRIAPESKGSCFAFSLDGTQFVVCSGPVVKVQRSDSKEIVATFSIPSGEIKCCCFSPDNQAIAVAAGITVYIWDITSTDPHLLDIRKQVLSTEPIEICVAYVGLHSTTERGVCYVRLWTTCYQIQSKVCLY